jgi:hypothetical protein
VKAVILMAAGKIRQGYFSAGETLFGFKNFCQPALEDVFERNQVRITIQKTLQVYIELLIYTSSVFSSC